MAWPRRSRKHHESPSCSPRRLLTSAALAQGPVNYPPEVSTMTDAQFLQWATAYNQQRVIEWQARKAKAQANQPQYLLGQTTESTDSYSSAATCGSQCRQLRRLRRLHVLWAGLWQRPPAITATAATRSRNARSRSRPPTRTTSVHVRSTLVNPYCPPRPSTAEEQAEIKRVYDVAGRQGADRAFGGRHATPYQGDR